MNSNPRAYALGLIGYPIGHSLSPRIHSAAMAALGLQGEYLLYPVPPLPEGRNTLQNLLERLRTGELHGLNVTIPHKQAVLEFLDELTPTARAVGAANTLFTQNGRLIGDNTDVEGFLADLDRSLNLNAHTQGGTALILGAGGAARAVVYALATAGWNILLAARRLEQACELAESLLARNDRSGGSRAIQPVPLSDLSSDLVEPIELIVNTTPLGAPPHSSASPWPSGLPFPPGVKVYDLVYSPAETCLVKAAREAGQKAAGGLGMLVEQAALAFERWTGAYPPRAALWAALQME